MTIASSRTFFYKRTTVGLHDFPNEPQITLPFTATNIIIVNDTDPRLDFSMKLPDLDGELFCEDDPLVLDGLTVSRVWFRSEATSDLRIWAWRK